MAPKGVSGLCGVRSISVAEEFDQLTALAFRHAANRLRGRDPAAAEEASGPRRTHLWHCEQEILNLGRLRVGGTRIPSIRTRPEASSFFNAARQLRISFACRKARSRCSRVCAGARSLLSPAIGGF